MGNEVDDDYKSIFHAYQFAVVRMRILRDEQRVHMVHYLGTHAKK